MGRHKWRNTLGTGIDLASKTYGAENRIDDQNRLPVDIHYKHIQNKQYITVILQFKIYQYLVSLPSKMYVFEDKLTTYWSV